MKRFVLAFVTALAASTSSFASDIFIDIARLTEQNKLLEPSTAELCATVGEKTCAFLESTCTTTPLKNICFQRSFLFITIDAKLCGANRMIECANERTQYEAQIREFSAKYASEPGYGRLAMNACAPFHSVPVAENQLLMDVANRLNAIQGGFGTYFKNKDFFNCIKSEYLQLVRNAAKAR